MREDRQPAHVPDNMNPPDNETPMEVSPDARTGPSAAPLLEQFMQEAL
jgi:hypothetical protein